LSDQKRTRCLRDRPPRLATVGADSQPARQLCVRFPCGICARPRCHHGRRQNFGRVGVRTRAATRGLFMSKSQFVTYKADARTVRP
jgi:hypothetical protein